MTRIKIDEKGKVMLSDIVGILNFRIDKHRDSIITHKEAISDNVDFSNIVTDSIIRINKLESKIEELQHIIEYYL